MARHSLKKEKHIARTVAVGGAAVVLACMVIFAMHGPVNADETSGEAQVPNVVGADAAQQVEAPDAALSYKDAKRASKKTETVRISTNPYGDVRSIKVETTLKNGRKADTLRDRSSLEDIEVDGERAHEVDGNRIVWDAHGEDVTYTGVSHEELPVAVTVYYKLDGTSVTADELAGASGHVKIRYVYENKLKSIKTINGENAEIATPFLAATALVLNNDVFKNIKSDGGKLIEDGNNTIAAGLVLPGLSDSLDLGDDVDLGVDLSDSFEVEADVKNFKLESAVTYITPSLLNGSDAGDLDTSEIDGAFGALGDGVDVLAQGTNSLASGLGKLDDGVGKLGTGLKSATNGSSQLSDGLATIQEQSTGLGTGAGQIKSGLSDLKGGVSAAQSALGSIVAGSGSADNPGLTGVAGQLEALAEQTEDEDQKAQLSAAASALRTYASSISAIADGGSVNSEQTAGLAGLASAIGSEDEESTLIGGVAALESGATALSTALGQTSEAASKLTSGMGQLSKGAKELKKGTAASQSGAEKLAEGMVKFNEQGIQKLADTFSSTVNGAKDRFDAIVDAGEKYQTFSGKTKKTKGSVTFIYQVDGIEKVEE